MKFSKPFIPLARNSQSWVARSFATTPPLTQVYGDLAPQLREHAPRITAEIQSKVTKAAARGIAGALVDQKTKTFNQLPYEQVFDTVLAAVNATMDNPVNIQPDAHGLFTSWDIFRRMGKNTWTIKEFVEMSVLKGKPFEAETVVDALRYTHLFSFTPTYSSELNDFNTRYKDHHHLAYDLRRVLEIEHQREKLGTHQKSFNESDIVDPHDILFTRWMERFPGNATEKDIAKDMFDIETFTPGKSQDEVMRYVIGVWAGSLATGLRIALTCGDPNGLFMGYGGLLWPPARLAVADVYRAPFLMLPDSEGKYTRRSITAAYALSVLYTANELWKFQDGHLHRHQPFYCNTLPETREAIAYGLRQTYEKSKELAKTQPAIPSETQAMSR